MALIGFLGTTMTQLRLELAEEELRSIEGGAVLGHDMSVNMFLRVGLELEEQQ